MPTNRTRRARTSNHPVIPKALYYYFETGDEDQSGFDERDRYNEFLQFGGGVGMSLLDYWKICRGEVMAACVKKHPGTRYWAWWIFDAPTEPRQRIGGIGTPICEVLGVGPSFDKGIPTGWIDQWQVDYYNGRAKDIHGNIIPTKYKDGDFKGLAIDPNDPPAFESEAAYLDRHGFLTPTEKAYIKKHPELLEPERITGA